MRQSVIELIPITFAKSEQNRVDDDSVVVECLRSIARSASAVRDLVFRACAHAYIYTSN